MSTRKKNYNSATPNPADEAVVDHFEAISGEAPPKSGGMPRPPTLDELFSHTEDSAEASSTMAAESDYDAYDDYDMPGSLAKRAEVGTLGDPINPGTPEEFVVGTRDRLSLYNRLIFDHRLQHIRKDQAIELAKKIFRYEYEIINQRVTLSLDIEKKRTFIEYMNASKDLQKVLLQVIGQAVEDLGDSLFEARVSILQGFGRRYSTLDAMVAKGRLTARQAARERRILDEDRNTALATVLKTARQLHLNTSKQLEQTLVLLRDDMLSKGTL